MAIDRKRTNSDSDNYCALCDEVHDTPTCEHGFIIGHCTECLKAKRAT